VCDARNDARWYIADKKDPVLEKYIHRNGCTIPDFIGNRLASNVKL